MKTDFRINQSRGSLKQKEKNEEEESLITEQFESSESEHKKSFKIIPKQQSQEAVL
jgi:hypothetical protein